MHVAEVGWSAAADAEIVAGALADARTVATLDADFHALLALTNATGPSVIRIRVEGLKAPAAATLLWPLAGMYSDALDRGAVITVTARNIRVRRLPLVRDAE